MQALNQPQCCSSCRCMPRMTAACGALLTTRVQSEVEQLQEQLAAKEAEAKHALDQAEAAKAAATAEAFAATSRMELQVQESRASFSLKCAEAAAAAQGLAAANADNVGLRAEVRAGFCIQLHGVLCLTVIYQVKEWLEELKCSRAAEESLSQQLQLLQEKHVQLQQELAAEVAAAAAGAAQIKELNELNVKLSGHNNQQQVRLGISFHAQLETVTL